ncbi:hypothetical protein HYX16_05780 [Candidatus Woesearchaeota archaeon]|nr:hypothetical protein [Candidatus Woesearchaeota archaeon]
MKLLNSKEIKGILNSLNEQYGINGLNLDYLFFLNKDNKIFLINKDYLRLNLDLLNINSLGMYFGKVENSGIRLSIYGSQLIGKFAAKNIFETDKKEEWLNGENLECDHNLREWVIVKSQEDYLGSGYCKDGILMNFIKKIKK